MFVNFCQYFLVYATVCQRLSVFASVVYRFFLFFLVLASVFQCLSVPVFFSTCLFQCLPVYVCVRARAHVCVIIIIIMYIYHAFINALSAHMIHINLNMIFYTHVKHSPTKTIYIKYYLKN